ncbi:hypothetical protein [Rheinheimera baltica]|uniref:hypothetical protein n=1 Tax=Rheinheimera baltica TaxID=67576 RepID=UPI00273F70DD|nr:hypothetical protein [Rheinheimera baltica]MDP5149786.1 hypothetical protein [Rheinheimera baltica]
MTKAAEFTEIDDNDHQFQQLLEQVEISQQQRRVLQQQNYALQQSIALAEARYKEALQQAERDTIARQYMARLQLRLVRHSIAGIQNLAETVSKTEKSDYILLALSGLFDADWYLQSYQDIKMVGVDPLLHYLQHGGKEGRQPSLYFDSNAYLQYYPDVAESGMNPLSHFLMIGLPQGRINQLKSDEQGFPWQ